MKTAVLAKVESSPKPIALVDMTVPELAETCRMLDDCQQRYDKLSGICAVMRGLVLSEAKRKLAHGKFIPWIKTNFKKTRKTAAQDMRLAQEFAKSNPRVTFQVLGRDLAETMMALDQAHLDLAHPLVKRVARWVKDRSRYQLLLEFPGESRGGDNTPRDDSGKRIAKPRRTNFELDQAAFEEESKEVCEATGENVQRLLLITGPRSQRAWFVLNDEQLAGLKKLLYDAYHGVLEFEKKRSWARRLGK
jgi:hypothetical protein